MQFRIFIIIFCLIAIMISAYNIIIESYKNSIFLKGNKIFHYFDTQLPFLHNGNINKMYPALIFTKMIDNSEPAGYRLDPTFTCFIGEYKKIINENDESLQLNRLFIMPLTKYNEIIKIYGPEFSAFNLIDENCLYIEYNEDEKDIDILVGNCSANEFPSFKLYKRIKNLLKRYYNVMTMKRRFLGFICIPPEILDIMMEIVIQEQNVA